MRRKESVSDRIGRARGMVTFHSSMDVAVAFVKAYVATEYGGTFEGQITVQTYPPDGYAVARLCDCFGCRMNFALMRMFRAFESSSTEAYVDSAMASKSNFNLN